MPSHSAVLLRHLRRLAEPPPSDADLLGRWISQRDEDAFALLVARHGAMVLGTCRRVLGGTPDAEDAFQAVFLTLARKATSLRRPEALAGWLHGVARRLACKARAAASRRPSAGPCPADREPLDPHLDPLDVLSARELLALIDREIGRLPEVYRLPVVLCDLEGRTQEEAAGLLGWTPGSVRGRLLRGRARLKDQLTRRGLTPAALTALLAAGSARTMADAAVPPVLAAEVTRAAVLFSTCATPRGISAGAAALARESMRGMLLTKLKLASAVLLAASAMVVGAGLLARQALVPQAAEEQAEKKTPSAQSNDKPTMRRDRAGDPLPAEAIARLGTIRFRHGGPIDSLAFTTDGQTIVSCGTWDGIRFWEAATGKEIRRFPEQAQARGIALSPDGKSLAILVSTPDPRAEAIAIRETATGRLLRRFGKPEGFGALLFSRDGKVLAAFHWPHTIALYDPATGRLLHTLKGHNDIVWSVAFSPDGKTLVSGSDDKTLRFWDVATGKQLRQITHNKGIGKIAWSPDGKLLASIDETKEVYQGGASWHSDNRVHLWDAASGKELRQLVMPAKELSPKVWGGFFSVAFAPDGKTIVTGGMDGTLRVWDPATGRQLRQVADFAGAAGRFAFAPDGKSVAVEDGNATVRRIDLDSGKDLAPTPGHRSGISSVVIAPDCQTVVTTSLDGTLRFWDATTGRERRRRAVPAHYFSVPRLLSDGKTYLTVGADKTFHVHDLATGGELALLRGHDARYPFALTPDRKTLASVSEDKKVRLLDPATGKERHTLMKVEEYLPGMSFTPDGRALVTWNADWTVTVWDAATGKKLRHFIAPRVEAPSYYTAALSPDGKLLAFGFQALNRIEPGRKTCVVPLVDTLTGKEVRRFRELEDGAQLLTFSPDGRMLAWSGWQDHTIHVGEIATGRVRKHFAGHPGSVEALAFSADGKLLISGSNDTTALAWDLTGRFASGDNWGKPLSAEELKTHWNMLAGEDAAAGYRAVQTLAADPMRSVPYLRERLHPIPAADEKRLTQWIVDLDSDQFAVREKAMAELEKLGELAVHALRKTLAGNPSLETRRRLEQLIEKQQREQWVPSAERLRIRRALEVLECAGTPEARQVLTTLAEGAPGAWLTLEAKAVLERLGKRVDATSQATSPKR